jgi:hypothetical protein
MILIFNITGGFTDMLKDLLCIYKFTNLHKIYFTIKQCTCRPFSNPCHFGLYDIEELFDTLSFNNNPFYVNYKEIENNITHENTYDFFSDKVKGNLFQSIQSEKRIKMREIFSTIIQLFEEQKKEFIFIGGGFRDYSCLDNVHERMKLVKTIKPSKKIQIEYEKNINILPKLYNLIHYRYEDDWIPYLKSRNLPYIIPPIDELIKNIPFKEDYKIYICTSQINLLQEKGLLYNNLNTYDTILTKIENDLHFDENGFLDFLIGMNAQEVYCGIGGFSNALNQVKGTKNYYHKMEIFAKYDTLCDQTIDR